MYDTIKDVINSGRYELNDMLHKIDTLWVQGDLDDDQRDELVELARENATPENTYVPIQEQIDQAFAQIKALVDRVAALEAGKTPEPSPEPAESSESAESAQTAAASAAPAETAAPATTPAAPASRRSRTRYGDAKPDYYEKFNKRGRERF